MSWYLTHWKCQPLTHSLPPTIISHSQCNCSKLVTISIFIMHSVIQFKQLVQLQRHDIKGVWLTAWSQTRRPRIMYWLLEGDTAWTPTTLMPPPLLGSHPPELSSRVITCARTWTRKSSSTALQAPGNRGTQTMEKKSLIIAHLSLFLTNRIISIASHS